MNQYDKTRDPMKLPKFGVHMLAMTAEDLNSKADIAVELAWRDQRIEDLLQAARGVLNALSHVHPTLSREDAERAAVLRLLEVTESFPHPCAQREAT